MAYKIKDLTSKPNHMEAEDILSSKERFLFWVEENRALVWGGILLFVVVIVAVITLSWLSQKKHEEAVGVTRKSPTDLSRPPYG